MGRTRKDGHYINVNISGDAFEMLEKHCLDSGQTKTMAIERAIRACYGPFPAVTREAMIAAQAQVTGKEARHGFE